MRITYLILILLCLPRLSLLHAQDSTGTARILETGKTIEREITGGDHHNYHFTVKKPGLLTIELEQSGSYMVLEVRKNNITVSEFVRTPAGEGVTNTTGFPYIRLFTEPGNVYDVKIFSYGEPKNYSYRLHVKESLVNDYKLQLQKLHAVDQWLKKKAISLKHVSAGNGFSDLMPLKAVLRDVQVVGLGEATHGSREFFQVKHRILEFLVKQLGFNLFAIEASQAACERINDYVLDGSGSPDVALKGQGFWQWNTVEVLEMIKWIRHYNLQVPESKKVKFYGFDFQVNDPAIKNILDYTQDYLPEKLDSIKGAATSLLPPDSTRPTYARFYTISESEKQQVHKIILDLYTLLTQEKEKLIQNSSKAQYIKALNSAKLLLQFTDTYTRPGYEEDKPESGVATRDRYMAENIRQIMQAEGSNAKIIVWSHNGHIKFSPYHMGYYLKQFFGNSYYAFGLIFNEGSFQAIGVGEKPAGVISEFKVVPAYHGSAGWHMNRAGLKYFAIDLRSAPKTGSVDQWLTSPIAMRSIGNGYAPANPSGYYRPPVVLKQSFDGLLFIRKTTRAVPIGNSAK